MNRTPDEESGDTNTTTNVAATTTNSNNWKKIGIAIGIIVIGIIVFVSIFVSRRRSIEITIVDDNQESIPSIIKVASLSSLASSTTTSTSSGITTANSPVVIIEYTTNLSDPTKKYYYLSIEDIDFTSMTNDNTDDSDDYHLILTRSPMPTLETINQEGNDDQNNNNIIVIPMINEQEFPYRLHDSFLPGDYNGVLIVQGGEVVSMTADNNPDDLNTNNNVFLWKKQNDNDNNSVEITSATFSIVVSPEENIGTDFGSMFPSVSPSVTPTQLPSTIPSKSPSAMPSYLPSTIPSSSTAPSNLPTTTYKPSHVPTNTPSQSPTTSMPSNMPSSNPTDTLHPSFHPTTTLQPTVSSGVPSMNPTISNIPTLQPSENPTDVPSKSPTNQPTVTPSNQPTTSPPTKNPTQNPTTQPTPMPTRTPTKSPTKMPTSSPTKQPTKQPTDNPTKQPTILLPPILTSTLESEDYNIAGTITIDYRSTFVSGQGIILQPIMQFNIPEAPRAPGPQLYLSKRSYDDTFETKNLNTNNNGGTEVYIPMDDKNDGSFTLQGTFEQPLDEISNFIDIVDDYTNGSWIVWCEPFNVWLGGGPITIQ